MRKDEKQARNDVGVATISTLLVIAVLFVNALTVYFYIQAARDKEQIERQDFVALYSAARLDAADLYDLQKQREIQIQVIGEPYGDPAGVLPFISPPVYIPLLKIVINDNYRASYLRWISLLVAVCALCGFLVYRITGDWVAAITATLFYSLFGAVVKGQISPFLTVAALMWGYFLNRGKHKSAGLSLALLLAKPHLAFAFGAVTLFASRKAFAWFLAATVITCLLILFFVGIDGVAQMAQISGLSVSSDDYGINREDQLNLLGLLIRAGLNTGTAVRLAWTVFAAVIGFSCWLTLNRTGLNALGLVTVLIVFSSPHLHLHDLSLLLFPMAVMSREITHKPLAFVPASSVFLFSRVLPYVWMGVLVAWLGRRRAS